LRRGVAGDRRRRSVAADIIRHPLAKAGSSGLASVEFHKNLAKITIQFEEIPLIEFGAKSIQILAEFETGSSMYRLLLVVAGVLFVTAAHAMTFSKAQLCVVLQPCEPPAQFASGSFVEKPVIRKITLREIQVVCGAGYRPFLGDRGVEAAVAAADAGAPSIMGCAQFVGSACVVHVPKDVEAAVPQLYALILAHELAHCRGWVHAKY
jgi:hypothetical protein